MLGEFFVLIVFFLLVVLGSFLESPTVLTIDDIKITEQTIINTVGDSKKEPTTTNKKNTINTKNSPNINYTEIDALLKEEAINVAQEELLSVKNIKVINLDNESKKDTLTGQLAGVTNAEFPDLFFVEFWKTPLNSKGYRMTRNRVILYGLSDFSSITIYKVDDNYYLKNDDVVYKISSGTEFKSMELVNDSDLLAKIN